MASSTHMAALQVAKKNIGHYNLKPRCIARNCKSSFLTLPYRKTNGLLLLLLILCNTPQVPAPVPRCSPLIFINKLSEWSNLKSDANPYFPVPPCEYGGPIGALKAKDFEAVSVLARPERIPLHNIYEGLWLIKTGFPRFIRMLLGKQKFVGDKRILYEGYQHHTKYPRTKKVGFKTHRDTSFINDIGKWKQHMKHKLQVLKTRGPDTFDPHEDFRDKGYLTKPTLLKNHYSQKRKVVLQPSNTFAQSAVENQHPAAQIKASQKFSQQTSEVFEHPNHRYDDSFKTPFISSLPYSQNKKSYYDSFRPINGISDGNSLPIKRNTVAFRLPEDTISEHSQYPAPSPFNYGDKISHRREGLFPKYSNEEKSRQFRPGSEVLKQIGDSSYFSPGENVNFGYNNPNVEGKFDLFNHQNRPSFSQIASGRFPSADEIRNINQPSKLLTADRGKNPNNYGTGGHVIDGSRKRNLKSISQPNHPQLRPTQNRDTLTNSGHLRNHKHLYNSRDKTSDPTVIQYMLSKIGL